MEYNKYIEGKKEIYQYFMHFIDKETKIDEHFTNLIKIIQKHKYEEKTEEFKSILYLIREVNKNHHRSLTYLGKIEQFLSHYEDYIKQSYSNDELLKIFKKNPQILQFLINKNIIAVDDSFVKLVHERLNPLFVFR